MTKKCEHLPMCGFFKKYQVTKDLACRGFMQRYCLGPKMKECKRKTYFKEHGKAPSNDMMPTGQLIATGN